MKPETSTRTIIQLRRQSMEALTLIASRFSKKGDMEDIAFAKSDSRIMLHLADTVIALTPEANGWKWPENGKENSL